MYQAMHEQRVMPIGFGRSLVWAVGVTSIVSVVAADPSHAHRPLVLPACLLGATIFYPFATKDRPRHAARGALLGALLLGPILESTQRPWVSMLSAAVVIGLLRSWFCWAKGSRFYLWRELSCVVASLALGGYLFDDTVLGLAFGVWGFCLGQVVAALFEDSMDRSDGVD